MFVWFIGNKTVVPADDSTAADDEKTHQLSLIKRTIIWLDSNCVSLWQAETLEGNFAYVLWVFRNVGL